MISSSAGKGKRMVNKVNANGNSHGFLALSFFAVLSWAFLSSCVAFDGSLEPPEITAEMPTEEKIAAAIDFGGETFEKVIRSIKQENSWAEAEPALVSLILKNFKTWQQGQYLNAAKLYRQTPYKLIDVLFANIVSDTDPFRTQIAWQLVGHAPRSEIISRLVDTVLSEAVTSNDIDRHLIVEMADAVKALDVKTVYGLMKMGLFKTGDASFVEAMISLMPEKSSDDLFDYAALVNLEEVRQKNLQSVNTLTVIQILDYLVRNPMNFAHEDLGKIFVLAASRNIGIRESARLVVENLVSSNPEMCAFELAKQPNWVQLSLIEATRRNMTAGYKVLLRELAKMTSNDVIEEEISELKF